QVRKIMSHPVVDSGYDNVNHNYRIGSLYLQKRRYRSLLFTLAHEMGHNVGMELDSPRRLFRSPGVNEWSADVFAAAFFERIGQETDWIFDEEYETICDTCKKGPARSGFLRFFRQHNAAREVNKFLIRQFREYRSRIPWTWSHLAQAILAEAARSAEKPPLADGVVPDFDETVAALLIDSLEIALGRSGQLEKEALKAEIAKKFPRKIVPRSIDANDHDGIDYVIPPYELLDRIFKNFIFKAGATVRWLMPLGLWLARKAPLKKFLGLETAPFGRTRTLRIAVLQNHPDSGVYLLNYLENYRRANKVDMEIVVFQASRGELPDLSQFDGVMGSGSPYNVDELDAEGAQWHKQEQALLRRAVEANKPVLGICFAHQNLAATFGGQVRRADHGLYVGRMKVRLTDPDDPLFAGVPSEIWASEAHGREVPASGVPLGFKKIAESELTAVEGIRHAQPDKKVYGLQFHPEVDLDVVDKTLSKGEMSNEHGRKILDNFLGIVRQEKGARLARLEKEYGAKVAWWLEEAFISIATVVAMNVPALAVYFVGLQGLVRLAFFLSHFPGMRGPPTLRNLYDQLGSALLVSLLSFLPYAFVPLGLDVSLATALYSLLGFVVHGLVNRGVFRGWRFLPSRPASVGSSVPPPDAVEDRRTKLGVSGLFEGYFGEKPSDPIAGVFAEAILAGKYGFENLSRYFQGSRQEKPASEEAARRISRKIEYIKLVRDAHRELLRTRQARLRSGGNIQFHLPTALWPELTHELAEFFMEEDAGERGVSETL
ncbi:MAG TPA: type 1 glutamine amidotransferase, partial [Elusimicrobiota bacterium]|nr:type 1 glutamine amidotransferase [Elusimicrobiota bacterium]